MLSFPFSETCFLFSSCEDVLECTECVTESKTCEVTFKGQDEEELCSSPVEGTLGQNILEFLPDVATEAGCLQACQANQDCVFYTHHRYL